MAKTLTVQEFYGLFPDDNACLDHLMAVRYGDVLDCPKCGKKGKFHRLRKEPAYACQWCGHRIYPMAGTPFERTHTALQKWFYAMYLFTTTRHGVPAKELQRQLGVTYKAAWRIGHEIRKYMAQVDGDDELSGHVEADEAYIGGRRHDGTTGRGSSRKAIVFGMLERGGNVMTRVVRDVRMATMERIILEKIKRGSEVSTDELGAYNRLLWLGYRHATVRHMAKEYVRGTTHVNSLEGFWSMIKRAIRGTHVHVSPKHLPKYLGEFEFRYNLRKHPEIMFARLLLSF